MLDICRNNNLFICNGRVGRDRLIGKPTCKDVSVIDYVLSSPMCLSMFSSFEVLQFSSLYSDVHCPVSFTLCVEHTDGSRTSTEHVGNTKTTDSETVPHKKIIYTILINLIYLFKI